MNRTQRLIHGALCFGTAAIPVGLILAAPVMREPRKAEPETAWVCHIDRELIEGRWEDVSKCHEEEIAQ